MRRGCLKNALSSLSCALGCPFAVLLFKRACGHCCRAKQAEEGRVKKEVQAHRRVVVDRQNVLETIGTKLEDLVMTWHKLCCSCSIQDACTICLFLQ